MPKQKPIIYLAYGSNLNLRQMAWRCPTAKPIGTTALPGCALTFRGGDGHAVATVEPTDDEGSVPALLWRIQPQDETALDLYEGWPNLYRKETVEVKLDGKPVEAMLYVMNEGYELGRPSLRYLEIIREGYRSAGFDESVLEQAVERSVPEHTFDQELPPLSGQQQEMGW